MTERVIKPARRLRGTIQPPGDKSISHRAAILNAIADGEAVVHNFLPGEDCRSTLTVLRALGVEHELDTSGDVSVLRITGAGIDGLREPPGVLDCANSGTTMRLMAGVLAGQPFLSVLDGDDSLRSRPMARIAEPLRRMGARIDGRDGARFAPLTVRGGGLHGIRYKLPMASAQVKSAVLLAALYAEGETIVEEPGPARDHTERMLDAMGAHIEREGPAVRITPGTRLEALSMRVPNDMSAAAFWIVAATVHPDAELRITGVGINPTRTGIIDALRAMGADLAIEEERVVGGEPVADIVVRSSQLEGTVVEGDLVPRLLDEAPVLAVAAAFARGTTEIRDAGELIVKESNRVATTASQLAALGVRIRERPDGMIIEGGNGIAGGNARSFGDHRLAMALAVAGVAGAGAVTIEGAECVGVSYPGFWRHLEAISR
ncbi:MAG: 3-phosphoshikimate 1-carboxyvinyltransferase [Dehalococcoidia bacterium]